MTEAESGERNLEHAGDSAANPHEVTQLLQAAASGHADSIDQLIPLLYGELRQLASRKMARESPGQTLQATALVHEAYLRLVQSKDRSWENRRHFLGAAAEAMRRILIERARRKRSAKRGSGQPLSPIDIDQIPLEAAPSLDIIDLDQALRALAAIDPQSAELVKLRFFAGLTIKQIAETIGVSPRKADNLWAYARAWLHRRLKEG